MFILTPTARPYYGRPSRPTTPRPRPMSLHISMSEHGRLMEERVEAMRDTCAKYGDTIAPTRRTIGNHT